MFSKCIAGGLLLTIALFSPNGFTQDSMNKELAQKHYELAEKLYQTSNYPEALLEFQKAYKLKSMPELLFNIARCHEVMANLEQAIKFYQQYLREKPAAGNRTLVSARVQNLQKRLEAKTQQARVEQQAQQARIKADQERAAKENYQPPPMEVPAGNDEGDEGDEGGAAAGWIRPTGWTALAVGGASMAAGIIFGAMASGKSSEYEDGVAAKMTYEELNAIDESGKQLQAAQLATLIVGGVLAAAGGGLLVWSHLQSGSTAEEAAPAEGALAPLITPTSVGLLGVIRY